MLRVVVTAAVLFAAPGGIAIASQLSAPEPHVAPVSPQERPPQENAAPPESPLPSGNVAGIYLCQGTNPDGSAYEGLVEIAAVDNTYLVHWMMADGAEVLGVGILRGGVLAVSYFGGTPAVAVYRIDGERLVGEWTMGGAEGMLYSETLTRMRITPAPPRDPASPRTPARPRPIRGARSA